MFEHYRNYLYSVWSHLLSNIFLALWIFYVKFYFSIHIFLFSFLILKKKYWNIQIPYVWTWIQNCSMLNSSGLRSPFLQQGFSELLSFFLVYFSHMNWDLSQCSHTEHFIRTWNGLLASWQSYSLSRENFPYCSLWLD